KTPEPGSPPDSAPLSLHRIDHMASRDGGSMEPNDHIRTRPSPQRDAPPPVGVYPTPEPRVSNGGGAPKPVASYEADATPDGVDVYPTGPSPRELAEAPRPRWDQLGTKELLT